MRLKQFLLVFGLSCLTISCNYRTPSKERFEKNTGTSLSDSITVLQDNFEESGPDYGLFYEFTIKAQDISRILEQLEKSDDWEKSGDRLEFQKTDNGIIYNILILKDENKIIYREELI